MSRLGSMLGGGAGGKSSAKRNVIGDFAKKNPDFMKLDASKRNELLMTMQAEARAVELSSRKGGSGGFQLPGTAAKKEEKELSKTAKDMMEALLKKQLKKRQKEVVSIRACWFGNGRIDSKGRIFDANNKEIGKIDQDTMKITIGWTNMGKYKDDSFTLTKLSNKIAVMNAPASSGGGGLGGGMGNFYGSSDSGSSGGSWW